MDELIGRWINWAGDDAGLGAIWGYGVEFEKNGEGLMIQWGTEIPKEDETEAFFWKRTGPAKIRITFPGESEYEDIEYVISDHIGGYDGKYHKITEANKSEFWVSPQPLYRAKKEPLRVR